MKKLILIILVLLCAGCGDIVYNYDLAVAQKEAEKHGGIGRIAVEAGRFHSVYCNDGVMFKVYNGQVKGN